MMKIRRHPAEAPGYGPAYAMAGPVLMIASAAVQAMSSIQQGRAAAAQGKYQAAQARQQAEREQQKAALQASLKRREGAKAVGAQRAQFANAGVDPGTGSAALATDETQQMSAFDALLALASGQEAANRLEQDARLAKYRGQVARSQSFLNAGSTLLSAGGRALSALPDTKPQSPYTGRTVVRAPNGQLRGFSGGRFGGGV